MLAKPQKKRLPLSIESIGLPGPDRAERDRDAALGGQDLAPVQSLLRSNLPEFLTENL